CLTLKQTFLIKLHRSWIPVSGHWDDTPLVAQTTTFVQLWIPRRYDEGEQRQYSYKLLISFLYHIFNLQ
ncbi:MAG: hypothetical protein LBE46_05195, partial [Wolbachia pipientis]|nr:hypothetical protein [Wolbachia pipientis]